MPTETICEGGYGGAARVLIQLRNTFPGIGGTLTTTQDITTAYRLPKSLDDEGVDESKDLSLDSRVSIEAANMFIKHALLKKLDDYFFRQGAYRYSHIPRPLGSTGKGGYMYEWVHGQCGFYSEYYDQEIGRFMPMQIAEWGTVSDKFNSAGISIFHDVADVDDGRYLNNIVLQEPSMPADAESVTSLWKRIDFGSESFYIDYDNLNRFIDSHTESMEKYLGKERTEMARLSARYLQTSGDPQNFPGFGRLEELIKEFRMSTLKHMGIQDFRSSKKLQTSNVEVVNPSEKIEQLSFSRPIKDNNLERLDMQIRSGFPCLDGTIYTMQEIAVGKLTLKDDTGFETFLRHFLAKKLENAFMSQRIYQKPHIPRPLGSEENSYYYEWVHGTPRCTREILERAEPDTREEGLAGWHHFVSSFAEAGIDMLSQIKYQTDAQGNEHANQVIIQQPYNNREPERFSRLWKRVNFHHSTTPIDLDKLERYLKTKEGILKNHLTPGRYETMLLAVMHLKGEELNYEETIDFEKGIHNYRISTLWHLNHYGFGEPPEGLKDIKVKR